MSVYFLTGGTGVVGSAIAQQLLADPSCRITLLIRANSDGDLVARREELLGSWELLTGAAERVSVVRGDTSLPRFGLILAAFRRLATGCTHIIHCAAIVKMNLPLEEARRSAVGAAKNVLALARSPAPGAPGESRVSEHRRRRRPPHGPLPEQLDQRNPGVPQHL